MTPMVSRHLFIDRAGRKLWPVIEERAKHAAIEGVLLVAHAEHGVGARFWGERLQLKSLPEAEAWALAEGWVPQCAWRVRYPLPEWLRKRPRPYQRKPPQGGPWGARPDGVARTDWALHLMQAYGLSQKRAAREAEVDQAAVSRARGRKTAAQSAA